jgi:peptide methionine sulfoxide reductase msrA/msrB
MPEAPDTIWRPIILLAGLIALIAITLMPKPMRSQENSMTPQNAEMTLNKLTPEEERVILHKGTEMPGTGQYNKSKGTGTYTCKQCNAPLYRSSDKFDSGCGWPSFDDEIPGAVRHTPDADGLRTEITCARCGGHLGHVFEGEGFTEKNTRHCVNSISLNFVPAGEKQAVVTPANATGDAVATQTAYFAGGCFWGVEHLLQKADGVISVRSGYMNGRTPKPTYKEVCYDNTGHAEAVEVVYDPAQTGYEAIARLFFEIHDPTQVNRQGPDIGDQYRSALFYADDSQKAIAEKLIGLLKSKGLKVATKVEKAGPFWPAEDYHQDYYDHKGTQPYCHGYTKRF